MNEDVQLCAEAITWCFEQWALEHRGHCSCGSALAADLHASSIPPVFAHEGALVCPAPAVPARWAVHGETKGGGPCIPRGAVPARWAVRGEVRPRAEAGSLRPTEGAIDKRSILLFMRAAEATEHLRLRPRDQLRLRS